MNKDMEEVALSDSIEGVSESNDLNFSVTNSAVNELEKILFLTSKAGHEVRQNLRISVKGGGCSGFSYSYELIEEINQKDIKIKAKNIIILIEEASAELLKNCALNFVNELGNKYFEIINPAVSAKCGCGNSFNI